VRPSFSFPRPSPPARQFPSFSSLAHADRRTPPVGVIPDLEPDLGSSPCPAAAPHVCPHRVSPKPARQGPWPPYLKRHPCPRSAYLEAPYPSWCM
jgi:hypothetical protein